MAKASDSTGLKPRGACGGGDRGGGGGGGGGGRSERGWDVKM